MTEPIKISQEELDNLLILREKIRANVESIGRLNIKRHFIEVELKSAQEELAHAYEESENLSMEEQRIVNETVQKYGDGDLDFNTGLYTTKQN
jgi:hypothetical protein